MTHDLVLSERTRAMVPNMFRPGWHASTSKVVKHHLYLCDEHWEDVLEWMKAYEGKE